MKDINQYIFAEEWQAVRNLIASPPSLPLRGDPDDYGPLHHLAMCKWHFLDDGKSADIPTIDELASGLMLIGDRPETIPEAACFGRLDLIKTMIDNGHKVDEMVGAPVGATGLLVAARFNYKDIVQYLLAHGASAQETDVEGRYAFDLTRNSDIKTILKEHGCPDKQTEDEAYDAYCTARSELNDLREVNLGIMRAAHSGDIHKIQQCLEKSTCKPWTLNIYFLPERETPLHIATKRGHLSAVGFLLEQGADTSIADQSGKTALDYALANNSMDMIALFKKYK